MIQQELILLGSSCNIHQRLSSLPKKLIEVVLKLKAVVEKLQSPLLLQLILITIPKVELDIIYKLVHIRQRQDFLKTHLDIG